MDPKVHLIKCKLTFLVKGDKVVYDGYLWDVYSAKRTFIHQHYRVILKRYVIHWTEDGNVYQFFYEGGEGGDAIFYKLVVQSFEK